MIPARLIVAGSVPNLVQWLNITESARPGRRGLFASFQPTTIVLGGVIAQAILLVILQVGGRPAASRWGWRVAFVAAGLSAIAALWAVRRVPPPTPDTAGAGESARRGAGSLRLVMTRHRRPLIWVIALVAGGSAAFYTYTVTVPTVLRETFFTADGADERSAVLTVLIGSLVLLALQPLAGHLSDRIGRRPLLILFAAGGFAYSGILLWVARVSSDAIIVTLAYLVAMVILTGYLSVNAVAEAEAFPPLIRALGVGLGYAIANVIFGGTAPAIYHLTATTDAGTTPFAVYLAALLAVTLAAALAMPRSRVSRPSRCRGAGYRGPRDAAEPGIAARGRICPIRPRGRRGAIASEGELTHDRLVP